MRNRIQAGWTILILMMISLSVTACVRPHPDSKANADEEPPVVPLVTQPAFIPPTSPSTPEPSSETQEPVDVPAPTPVPIEPTAEPAAETTYIVVAGDTLFKIALEHDVTVDDIAKANGIIDIDSLEIGQKLIIPAPGTGGDTGTEGAGQDANEEAGSEAEPEPTVPETASPTPVSAAGSVYIVKPGDNLFRIGLQYGCSVEQLALHNGITTPNRISVGMEIKIPDCNN